ncbi:MAG: hypothetical protein LBH25_07180 [Fibromonadaceae bacterium]|jgi:antitoxin (DNA-binding transcriptional repressor) of toxin-antitoxin stability system|nr:hypothetical protein [Fibromonadaceae bacterium]
MNILLDASAIMAIILNEPNRGKDVVITRKDGVKFKLIPMQAKVKKQKSLLTGIKGVSANVTMDDILESIRDRKV